MIRRTALIASISAALLAPVVVAAAPGAAATTAATITSSRQGIDLTLTSVTPEYATERATEIKVMGTVRNTGSAPLQGLRVRVRYGSQRFADRGAMATYATDTTTATQPPNVSTQSSQVIPELAANASVDFELVMTPAQFGLTAFGAYPLSVEVVQWDAVQLASQRTFLTYAPATAQQRPVRNRLSFVLPVIDQPHRADDGTFADDDLAAALTGKGRLADLARIAEIAPASVTWVVDPALFDDVDAMTRKFRVKTGKNVQDRPAEPAAAQWLTAMRAALADNPVIATPYADPDMTALAHRGLDNQPARALELARQKAALIKNDVKTSTYWPAGGVLDADALDLLAVGAPGITRVDKVLLDPANLPTQQDASAAAAPLPSPVTPDAATTLDTVMGPVTALVADAELSRTLEPTPGTRGATLLSRQRFIAETAMIAAEPGQTRPRSLVVAPSRRWNPSPGLVTTLLRTAGKLPWLTLTPLDSIKVPRDPAPRAGLTYSDRDRKQELGAKYLEPVREVAEQAELTAKVAGQQRSSFDAAVLRLTSSAWRGDAAKTGRRLIERVEEAVEDRAEKVSITGAGPDQPRTLAGANGDVPISVRNELDTPVTLFVAAKSDDPDVLEVDFRQQLQVGGEQSGTVQIPMTVTSERSGDASVTVQLMTVDGRPYGEPVKLIVRTTGYTGIALVIVGGALTVMLAAVVTRVLRRRTQRHRARSARTRESETV